MRKFFILQFAKINAGKLKNIFINNLCWMQKLISRILISAKINLGKIRKKKRFSDFDICSFAFLPRFHAVFWSSRKCYSLYYLQPCPKIAYSTKISLVRTWDTKVKNDIPTLALITLHKMIQTRFSLLNIVLLLNIRNLNQVLQRLIFQSSLKNIRRPCYHVYLKQQIIIF